jgi:hypothetical protein
MSSEDPLFNQVKDKEQDRIYADVAGMVCDFCATHSPSPKLSRWQKDCERESRGDEKSGSTETEQNICVFNLQTLFTDL